MFNIYGVCIVRMYYKIWGGTVGPVSIIPPRIDRKVRKCMLSISQVLIVELTTKLGSGMIMNCSGSRLIYRIMPYFNRPANAHARIASTS